jgi:hypothetical protein
MRTRGGWIAGKAGETEGDGGELCCALARAMIRALESRDEFVDAAEERVACRNAVAGFARLHARVRRRAADQFERSVVDVAAQAVVSRVEGACQFAEEIGFIVRMQRAFREAVEVFEDGGDMGIGHRPHLLCQRKRKEPAEEGGDPVHGAQSASGRKV